MSESEKGAAINTSIWHGQLMVVAGWSLVCGMCWLAMMVMLAGQERDPSLTAQEVETATAGAGCILTGCAGGGWLCGMASIVIVFAAVRR